MVKFNILYFFLYRYPKQILSLLSRMPKTEERRSEQATYIMYLYYLIHLHNLKQKQLRDKGKLITNKAWLLSFRHNNFLHESVAAIVPSGSSII